jgi:2-furoyl-CoA dehydrogenase large subunit
METFIYDETGNLLTSSFSDYCPITSMNMPDVKYGSIQTPSPFSYNGAKGMGEGGGAPLHTVSAAVQDALVTEGIIVTDSHHSVTSVFELLRNEDKSFGVHVEKR